MYEYEIEALVVAKNTGRKVRKFTVKFSKPHNQWYMTDYEILEKYLGKRKDVMGDVSIIDVKEPK